MRSRLYPILFLALLPACSGGTGSEVRTPAHIDVVTGTNQTGIYGQALAAPLVVHVTDANGQNVPSATVVWSASSGTLAAATTVTDTFGRSSNTWTLGTGTPTQSVAAAVAVPGVAPAVFTATGRPAVPLVIHSCETNTATLCADWTWAVGSDHYVADWSQGSHAVITVDHFGTDSVRFTRDDPSGTSAGMHAVYRGLPVGNAVPQGMVTWTNQGQTFSGTWQASW